MFDVKLYKKLFGDGLFAPEQEGGYRRREEVVKTEMDGEEEAPMEADEYRKRLNGLESQMHSYLERMYTCKWRPKKEDPQGSTSTEPKQKPLMDIKYKRYASPGSSSLSALNKNTSLSPASPPSPLCVLERYTKPPVDLLFPDRGKTPGLSVKQKEGA